MPAIFDLDSNPGMIVVSSGQPSSAVGIITVDALPTTAQGCIINSISTAGSVRHAVNYSIGRVPYFYVFGGDLVVMNISGIMSRYSCSGANPSANRVNLAFLETMESGAPWNGIYWIIKFLGNDVNDVHEFHGLLVQYDYSVMSQGFQQRFNVTLKGIFVS